MIGATAAVGADGDADHRANGELALAEITGFGDLGHQLVEPGIDIIGELDLDDRLGANSAHPYGGADDISLLDGRIEYPVITELFGQGSRLSEDAAKPAADILTIKQDFRMIGHDLTDRKKGGVDHDDLLAA